MSPWRGIQPPSTLDVLAAGCMQRVSGLVPKQTGTLRRTAALLMLPACSVRLEHLNRAHLAKRDADTSRALRQPDPHSCFWTRSNADAQDQS